MTWDKYKALIFESPGISGGNPPGIGKYYSGHIQRFELGFDMLAGIKPASVLDIGTGFPFYSWYFAIEHGSRVTFGSPEVAEHDFAEGVKGVPMDVCMSRALPTADLVIATEMLEHIWCNVERVVDMISAAARRWVFVSFPCGGKNAKDYDQNIEARRGNIDDHVREFTDQSARDMASRISGRVVDCRQTATSLYHAPIVHYLIDKDA